MSGTSDARRAAARRPRRGRDSPLFVGSLAKGLRVLGAFAEAGQALRLTEIAIATGLDKSAAQRFTHTLHTLGYLRKDPQTRRYSLSPKALELGFSYLRTDALIERATPYLLEANKRTEETVNLTELDDTEIVYVARVPSRRTLNVDVLLGTRLPAWCTAAGRAILAHLPEARAQGVIERSARRAYTAMTVTEPAAIVDLLHRAKADGFALAAEEYTLAEISVAAPVLDFAGRPLGAVNVAVPTAAWRVVDARRRLAPIVVETARAVSRAEGSQQALPPVPRLRLLDVAGGA